MSALSLLFAAVVALCVIVITPILLLVDAQRASAFEELATEMSKGLVMTSVPKYEQSLLVFEHLLQESKNHPQRSSISSPLPVVRKLFRFANAKPQRSTPIVSPALSEFPSGSQERAVLSMAKMIMMRHNKRRVRRPRAYQQPPPRSFT